jgi:GNAT superfamily N-acetyltransferase
MAHPTKWRIERRGPKDPIVEDMVASYLAELRAKYPDFDPALASAPTPTDFIWPNGCFLLIMAGNEAVGLGAIRRLSDSVGELRRMWVKPAWRGQQAGRYLLEALEMLAREMDIVELCLDSKNGLDPALSLYRSAGFDDVPRYNDNDFADIWLAKHF